MKSTIKRVLAGALSAMMVFFCAVVLPATEAMAFDNSVKSGVVAIVFYLKDAGIYITDGTNYQEMKHLGDTQFSAGSGFFIGEKESAPTRIVTNCHVIDSFLAANEGETFIWDSGELYNNTYPILVAAPSCEMRVYYSENDYDVAYVDCHGDSSKVDLAVLKLKNPTTKRKALKLQKPTEDMVGSTVYTIGYPGNADNQFTGASKYGVEDATVHKGVINRFGINEGKGVERIAIDATIQHGNSGGPLVNEECNVLGVNTNVESKSPYEGQVEADYYAISSNELINFLDKNDIPYMMAGGSNMIVIIVIVAVAVLLLSAASVVALIIILKKIKQKKAAAAAADGGAGTEGFGEGAASPDFGTNGFGTDTSSGSSSVGNYGVTVAPSATAKGIIRSLAPQHSGKKYPVGLAAVTVGRNAADCEIVYQAGTPGVSGKHCSVVFDSKTREFTVTDLRSTFGTFLSSGQKLTPNVPTALKPGDSFYVGDKANVLTVELEN